ncbi:uncharacterized protein LOC131617252 isoform X1 [Vicia villosa]|uniref:uncharacterized protein LOC131617252 isoform X1 n=1 Tax=Vicia villosa TaxID=3911 RepID=UPI00273AB88F|nr:uncharacterized protein LOC131617252 isoform X1 [Vicia villosa]
MHTLKAGPILVAISPFKKVPMYGNNYIEAYKRKITKSPHVYAITNTTIREMIRDEVNQSIIIREANTTSVPVARPIWMEFPSDEATFSSDEAFMVGNSILVQEIYTRALISLQTHVFFQLIISFYFVVLIWSFYISLLLAAS